MLWLFSYGFGFVPMMLVIGPEESEVAKEKPIYYSRAKRTSQKKPSKKLIAVPFARSFGLEY